MAFFSTLSAFMEEARDQLDELMAAVADGDRAPTLAAAADTDAAPRAVPADLDPSVAHDTYVFVARLVEDRDQARKLFLSYANVLKKQQQQQQPSREAKFALTREQNLHARSIIQALPALDRLRFELCPSSMQDHCFWRVYFSLVQDKDCVAAPKVPPAAPRSAKPRIATQPQQSQRAQPQVPQSPASAAKAHVPSAEDVHKGVKRERDEDMTPGQGLSEDLVTVSRLLMRGAHRTMQLAAGAFAVADAPAATPTAPAAAAADADADADTNAAATEAATAASKRGRFLPRAAQAARTEAASEPPTEARSVGSAAEADGFSVASVEDAELQDWAAVSPSARKPGRASRRSAGGVLSEPLSDDEAAAFELI